MDGRVPRYRRRMESSRSFVPAGFVPPRRLAAQAFVLEPLGPQHNETDYAAWSSSLEHIRATPGFARGSWPSESSLAENLADLEGHARDFASRRGFTYAVLDPADRNVIGCVYIYPPDDIDADPEADRDVHDASVRSWVRADRAELDQPLWRAVRRWLQAEWPFERVRYARRH